MAIINPLFERQRQRATQQAKAQEDEALQALRRRLAATGGLQSGAGLKLEERIRQQGQEQLTGALGDITAQEAQFGLQQEEAERARAFQAQEAALARQAQESQFGRQLGAQESQFGRQLAAQESQLAKQLAAQQQLQAGQQQFQAGESALERRLRQEEAQAQRQFATQERLGAQEFAKIESSLGRESAMKLQQSAEANARALADLDLTARREGIVSQEKINQANLDSQAKLEGLKLEYSKAKDAEDRRILEKQMKNELTFSLMTQGIALAELAKVGLAPSEAAAMVNSFLGNAVSFNPDGTIKFNTNWSPTATIAPIETTTTTRQIGLGGNTSPQLPMRFGFGTLAGLGTSSLA